MTSLLERVSDLRPGFWESPFTANLVAQMRLVSAPRVSPDGRYVAYLQDYNQRADLWVMPIRGGASRLVTADAPCVLGSGNAPLSGGYGAGFVWMPDSATLVYTSSDDHKLHCVSRDGGRSVRLTEGPGSDLAPSVAPDGSFVAYTVDRGDVDDQVFIALRAVDAHQPTMRRITPPGVVALDPQVSPDGTRVACVLYPLHDRWAHDAQIAVIELASGTITVLTPTVNVVNNSPRWSPDGETLAFISDRSGFFNLWLIPSRGGEPYSIATEEYEQWDLCWSHDGRRIAYTRTAMGDTQVMVAEIATGTAMCVSTARGVHAALSWHRDGASVCALHQSPDHPPNVSVCDTQGGGQIWLTDTAVGGLSEPDYFAYPEHVEWRSTDGLNVYGLLFTPKRVIPGRHPALVHMHGGPTNQTAMGWDPVTQYFVSRGWVVISPNYRGSTGYGRGYTDLLHGAWGEGDLQDNVTSINVIRERRLMDERRVVAWGGSAGGYATYACMTMAGNVFAAGIAIAGITDFIAMREHSDRYGRDLPEAELGALSEQADLWRVRSPITHAAQVSGPMLILQGNADRRVPPSQSEAMVRALQMAGKTVEYQVYEGEGHGWRKCATIRDAISRMDAFLTRYILDR